MDRDLMRKTIWSSLSDGSIFWPIQQLHAWGSVGSSVLNGNCSNSRRGRLQHVGRTKTTLNQGKLIRFVTYSLFIYGNILDLQSRDLSYIQSNISISNFRKQALFH